MSNLLPESARLELRKEYRARYLLAGSYLGLGTAVFMMLSLLPSYMVLHTTKSSEKQVETSQEIKTDMADIARVQSLVAQLSPVITGTSTVSQAISEALSVRPSGAHIDEVTFDTS